MARGQFLRQARPGEAKGQIPAEASNALFRGAVGQSGDAVALAMGTGANTLFGEAAKSLRRRAIGLRRQVWADRPGNTGVCRMDTARFVSLLSASTVRAFAGSLRLICPLLNFSYAIMSRATRSVRMALSREQNLAASRLEASAQVQAAVAARHARNASSRKTRSVRRDVRWRWTLNVFWTAA